MGFVLDYDFYFAISAIVFLFLSVIWRKSDWVNTILKIVFIVMTAISTIHTLTIMGYVVR